MLKLMVLRLADDLQREEVPVAGAAGLSEPQLTNIVPLMAFVAPGCLFLVTFSEIIRQGYVFMGSGTLWSEMAPLVSSATAQSCNPMRRNRNGPPRPRGGDAGYLCGVILPLPIPRRPSFCTVLRCAVAFCFVVPAAGCTRLSEQGSSTVQDLGSVPDQESWNAELRISSEGRPRLVMAAAYMARYESRDTTYAVLGADPQGGDSTLVRVELFDEAGEPTALLTTKELTYFDRERRFEGVGDVEAVLLRAGGARLTADRLTYNEGDGRFVASGNVLVVSQDGKRLTAEEVVWDADAKQIRVHGAFRFTTRSEHISGYGLVASEDLARYSFSRASGELEVEE